MGTLGTLAAIAFLIWLGVRLIKKNASHDKIIATAKAILADDAVTQSEVEALLSILDAQPLAERKQQYRALHATLRRAMADGVLDIRESEEIRVLLGELLDRDLRRESTATRRYHQPPRKSRKASPPPKTKKAAAIPLAPGMEVAMWYENAAGEASEREVTITKITRKNGLYYVGGICHMRNAYRTFRADRIEDMAIIETGEIVADVMGAVRMAA